MRRDDGRAGFASLEFALMLPAMLVLFVAVAETLLYMRTWYRLDRTAMEIANITSQYETMTTAVVGQLFDAANSIASPIPANSATGNASSRARTLIGVVSNTGSGNTLSWTCSRGDSSLPNTIAGQRALPNGLVVPSGQTLVVVEVINGTRPWQTLVRLATITKFLRIEVPDPGPIRTYALVRPRIGTLSALSGGCPA
jgi:Flp pilus assembly protein TadG